MASQSSTPSGILLKGRTRSPQSSPSKSVKFDESTTRSKTFPGGSQSPKKGSRSQSSFSFNTDDLEASPRLQSAKRRLERVQSALSKLQPPSRKGSTSSTTDWTADHPEIVSDNITVLRQAAETTPDVEERRVSADRAASKAAKNASAEKAARAAQNAALQRNKKRRRQVSTAYDSDGSDGGNDYPRFSTRGSPSRNRPAKRPRMISGQVQVQPIVDLATLAPQPLRITYKPHPLCDRTDEWYSGMFCRLYRQTDKFVSYYFEVHDLLAQGEKLYEPWLGLKAESTPEFVTWVEQVAGADPGMNGWDGLLRNTNQRKWLVMGILTRILRVKIFDADLWGAEVEEKKLLLGIERALLGPDREGFQRTALRAKTVRTILGPRPITTNFYSEVANLTAQVALLLKPLSDFLYSIPPSSPDIKLPRIKDQYQSLHNIISTAAYLSLCIRLSPTIFHFRDISLGDSFDPTDQLNLDMVYYTESRERVLSGHYQARENWFKELNAAKTTLQTLIDAGREESKAGQKALKAYENLKAVPPPQPGQTHQPQCKIAVWPQITRYKAGSDADDEAEQKGAQIPMEERDGMRIMPIGKAGIVCYFGEKERKARVKLSQFLEDKKKRFAPLEDRGYMGVGGVATLAVVLSMGWFWKEALRERTGIDLGGLVEMAGGSRVVF